MFDQESVGPLVAGMQSEAPITGPEDALPGIEVDLDLERVVTESIAALAACPDVYRRGGELVHVVTDEDRPLATVSCIRTPRIRGLEVALLRVKLSTVAQFIRKRKNKKTGDIDTVAVLPPIEVLQGIIACKSYPGLRCLEGVVEAPTLRPDGSVLDVAGYDAATGLLYVPSIAFAPVPERPTIDDAKLARDALYGVVSDFPFASRDHFAVWLAATLTLFARYAVDGPVPLTLVDSNIRGAGKGLVVDAGTMIATGRPAPTMANPSTDEEMEKRIMALSLAGLSTVLIDNIADTLGCASLDMALTSRTFRGRRLGQTEILEAPMNIVFFATGNDVALAADTARRTMHVRLESREEHPEERDGFSHPNLRQWVSENRARLAADCLTILRAYHVAGRPDMKLKPWGSFEAWSSLVRSAVVWVGESDPAQTRIELASHADTEAIALRALIECMEEIDPKGAGLTVGELIDIAKPVGKFEMRVDNPALREAIGGVCQTRDGKETTSQSLAKKLQHFKRRVIGGRQIDMLPNTKTNRWHVRRAS